MSSNSPLNELELLFYLSSFFNFARGERDDKGSRLRSMQMDRLERKIDYLISLLEEIKNE